MRPIILFISFLVIISSCYRSNEKEDWKEYTRLDKFFVDTLKDEKNNRGIFWMELKIKGYVKGKAKLYFSQAPYEDKSLIVLEGFVNESIEMADWYDDRCLIIYDPENPSVAGKIYIKFKVFTQLSARDYIGYFLEENR